MKYKYHKLIKLIKNKEYVKVEKFLIKHPELNLGLAKEENDFWLKKLEEIKR